MYFQIYCRSTKETGNTEAVRHHFCECALFVCTDVLIHVVVDMYVHVRVYTQTYTFDFYIYVCVHVKSMRQNRERDRDGESEMERETSLFGVVFMYAHKQVFAILHSFQVFAMFS